MTQQKCKACDKTVYPVELLSADGVGYHKSCFKCTHCKSILQLSRYSSMDGVLYCKPHFEQLFKESGSFNKNFQSHVFPVGGPTLPILQKNIDLSNKIKVLKDEHAMVSNYVKQIKNCSFCRTRNFKCSPASEHHSLNVIHPIELCWKT